MTIRNSASKAQVLSCMKAFALLPLFAAAPTAVLAQETTDIQAAESEELLQRVNQLEEMLRGSVSTAPEMTETEPYILREGDGLKIGGTTISFGGFIKADLIFGSNGDGSANTYSVGVPLNFASAAASGNNEWNTGFSARESRFSFGTETEDVAGHTLKTYLEMDFNQGKNADGNEVVSNSYSPRLRQAYGNWNNWDVGQTYTTFSDLAAMPEILNQGKQAAFIYTTQPMIRYNVNMSGSRFLIALENPEDGFGTTSYDDQSYPDLTFRYQVRSSNGFYSIAGLVRNLEDDTADEEELTGGIALSARIPFGKDDLRLQYAYGALGRYMGSFTYPDVDLGAQAAGDVDPLKVYGATVAYRHFWTPTWRSNIALSHTEMVDNLEFSPIGSLSYFDSSTSAQFNVIWQAHKNLQLGLEYAYWDFGEIASAGSQQYEQVMASAKMNF